MALPHASSASDTPISAASATLVHGRVSAPGVGVWTQEECQRFREAMATYPTGPWSKIAARIGTRTVRQAMTHAQKCQQRIERHVRGLRPAGRRRRTQSEPSASPSSSTPRQTDHVETARTPGVGVSDELESRVVNDRALADALTFDWVSAYLKSPPWLAFEVSADQHDAP